MQNYVTFKLLLRKKLRMTRQASLFFNPHSSYPISVLSIVVFFINFGSLLNIFIVHTQYLYCQLLYFSSILVVYPISILFTANIYIVNCCIFLQFWWKWGMQQMYHWTLFAEEQKSWKISERDFVLRRISHTQNKWKNYSKSPYKSLEVLIKMSLCTSPDKKFW